MDDYLVDEIIDLYPPLLQAVDDSGRVITEQLAREEGWAWNGNEIIQTEPTLFYFQEAATIVAIIIQYGDGDYTHVNIGPVTVTCGDEICFTRTIKKNTNDG